ncbi:MAG: MerR family transcriptional regulator [Gammaproteobacteria bacterium]|nr:MAG: MerR family transcriptional regulator [Gammaproteobacteria bacterium]
MGQWLSIGALSRATGVKVETIRYYERIGLMPAPLRSEGGHRQFREAELRRLRFIRRARELGFTLDEVRELLKLADGGAPCAEVEVMARAHLTGVRERIADLQRLAESLAHLTRRCERVDTSAVCPLIDDLFGD